MLRGDKTKLVLLLLFALGFLLLLGMHFSVGKVQVLPSCMCGCLVLGGSCPLTSSPLEEKNGSAGPKMARAALRFCVHCATSHTPSIRVSVLYVY